MQSDSVRTTSSSLQNKPIQIETGGNKGMILPKIEISELIEHSQTNEIEIHHRRKQQIESEGVILTPDSTNYFIIPNQQKGTFQFPKLEVLKKNTISFDSLAKLNSHVADTSAINPQASTSVYLNKERDGFYGVKPNARIHQDSTFILILVCFLLIVFAIKTEGEKIKKNIKSILITDPANRDKTSIPLIIDLCLTIQVALITGILLFHIFALNLPPNLQISSMALTLLISFTTLIFVGFKMMMYQILGCVFSDTRRISNMTQKFITTVQLFGIFSFLPVLILIYSDGLDIIMLSLIGILFLCERLIAIYHVISNFLQEKINFLFLIVYLCTVEILPYFFLYEIANFVYKLDITSILWH